MTPCVLEFLNAMTTVMKNEIPTFAGVYTFDVAKEIVQSSATLGGVQIEDAYKTTVMALDYVVPWNADLVRNFEQAQNFFNHAEVQTLTQGLAQNFVEVF